MTVAISHPSRRSATVALVQRDVAERRRLIIGLSVAAIAFAAMIAALYSSVGPTYDETLQGLPDAIRSMLGNADFSTPEGFLHVELFTFVAPGLAISAAVSVAAGSLAGAEQSGRLALITASPIARARVVTAAIAATAVAVVSVSIGLLVGIGVGGWAGDLGIGIGHVVAACTSLGLLALAVGMITLATGAVTGRRGLAVGVGTGVAVVSYAIDAFFPMSSTLEPFAKISLWYPFAHHLPLVNGLDPVGALILLSVSVAAAAVAYRAFDRRDIHT